MKVLFRKRPKTTKKTYNFYIHQLNTKKAMSPTSDWVLFLFKWQDYSEQMCTEQSCTETNVFIFTPAYWPLMFQNVIFWFLPELLRNFY